MPHQLPAGWELLIYDLHNAAWCFLTERQGRPPGVLVAKFAAAPTLTPATLMAALARDRHYQAGRAGHFIGARLLDCVVVFDQAGVIGVFAFDHTEACTLWASLDRAGDAARLRALALALARGHGAARRLRRPAPAPQAPARVRVPKQPRRLALWREVWRTIQGIPGGNALTREALLREVHQRLNITRPKTPRTLSDKTLDRIIQAGQAGRLND
jgi:hypothetical protein